MQLKLIRDIDNGECTIGRLFADGEFLCFTLENTWADNEPRVSCIPEGTYEMDMKAYGRYWEKYKPLEIPILKDVPNRSQILIHPGNYAKDTLGCILVGDSKGENAVFNSRKTWKAIHNILKIAETIEIVKE